jgi:ribokinase
MSVLTVHKSALDNSICHKQNTIVVNRFINRTVFRLRIEECVNKTRRVVVVGSANMDIVIRVERLPVAGETIAGGDAALFTGGKGANQACAARKLGGDVAFIAQVGDDPFGTELLSALRLADIDVRTVGISDTRATGCALICVLPGGENSIVISPGANANLTSEKVLAQLTTVESIGFILLQLETPLDIVSSVLRFARSRGITTILDPAPACMLSPELLSLVDILTPNQSETAILLGRTPGSIENFSEAERAARSLLALGPGKIVMKLGALGCLVLNGDTASRVNGVAVEAVDTTGAGDAFNGALAVALAEGKSLVKSATFANAAAAISVTRLGAQSSLPSRDEVDQFGDHLVTA